METVTTLFPHSSLFTLSISPHHLSGVSNLSAFTSWHTTLPLPLLGVPGEQVEGLCGRCVCVRVHHTASLKHSGSSHARPDAHRHHSEAAVLAALLHLVQQGGDAASA